MTLPPNPSLSWALAFWCGALGSAAVITAIAASIAVSPAWGLGVLAAAATVGAAGMLEPGIIERAYQGWNALARAYERFMRGAILRVCFFVVVLSTSLSRSGKLALARPVADTSCWVPRPAPGIETWGRGDASGGRRRWLRYYAAWSWRSGNVWTLFLLPFVLLLLALETEDSTALPDRLYTLY